jgi:hypothetical protein
MSVPSLSWQNDRFYLYMAQKRRFVAPLVLSSAVTLPAGEEKHPLLFKGVSSQSVSPERVLVNWPFFQKKLYKIRGRERRVRLSQEEVRKRAF